jgi:fumarate hydratase subunit alpha
VRKLEVAQLTQAVADMVQKANYELDKDVYCALQRAAVMEESPHGRDVLEQLLQNAEIAKKEKVPICQDTGFTVIFLELGQDVNLTGGDVNEALQEGVRLGYKSGYLRQSIVADPLRRVNTNDNTPAVIHWQLVPGTSVRITVMPKGGGSENASAVKMLKLADGAAGVMDFVVETVSQAGSNACPPMVVGVGIGGTLEKAAALAKKALMRPLGKPHPDAYYSAMEKELLERLNRLGVGPAGLGGKITVLAVQIETFPAHIASLPVAVNINCHAARHLTRVI